MSGLGTFRRWQGRYAEHRIATFPVRHDKRPLIRNYQRIGLNASGQLAARFADEAAFAFMCGQQSGIVIIDIDTDDEQALRDALQVFGWSPMFWRTGSGHFAIAYRWNGETRRIRPLPDLPIDILGGGGFVIAPPSLTKGVYRFLRGGLDDLGRLPYARTDKIAPTTAKIIPFPSRHSAALIQQGERHEALKHSLAFEIWYADDREGFLDRAITVGTMHCTPPLEAAEITELAAWFWRHKEMGLLRRPGHRHWTQDVRDLLLIDRNAGALLHVLRVIIPVSTSTSLSPTLWRPCSA